MAVNRRTPKACFHGFRLRCPSLRFFAIRFRFKPSPPVMERQLARPVIVCIHTEIPARYQNDSKDVPITLCTVDQVQEQHCDNYAESTKGVEDEEAAENAAPHPPCRCPFPLNWRGRFSGKSRIHSRGNC